MAYIGRDIEYGVLEKQTLTADSSTTAFTLDYGVGSATALIVSVGGIVQEPDVAYTASGTTITFSEAPVTGDSVFLIYIEKELITSTIKPTDWVHYEVETGNGSTTDFSLDYAPASVQDLMVSINGVNQRPTTDFTVNGSTLTMTTAPQVGVKILVIHLRINLGEGNLADGQVTSDSILSMDASKLTGSLPLGMGASTLVPQYNDLNNLALRWATVDNKVATNLAHDFIDHFQDDTGYDPSSHTVFTPSSSSDWAAPTGDPAGSIAGNTFSSGRLFYANGGDEALRSDTTLVGDFELEVTVTEGQTAGAWVGVFDASEIGTFTHHETGNMHSMNNSYYYAAISRAGQTNGFTAITSGSSNNTAYTSSNGDVVKIKRVGSTITQYLNGTLKATATGVPTGAMYVCLGGGGGSASVESDYTSITWIKDQQTPNTGSNNVGRNATEEYVASTFTEYGSAAYLTENSISDDTITWINNSVLGISDGSMNTPYQLDNTFSQMFNTPIGNLGSYTWYWDNPSTSGTVGNEAGFTIDYGSKIRFINFKMHRNTTAGEVMSFRLRYSDDNSNWTLFDLTGSTFTASPELTAAGHPDNIWSTSTKDANGIFSTTHAGSSGQMAGSIWTPATPFEARYVHFGIVSWANRGNNNVGWGQFVPTVQTATTTNNATGTLISTTSTAADTVSKTTGVMLYKNSAGTNTLGTDLKVYFSANNGTNWTEAASYGTATTFDGTTMAVPLGETTLANTGTQVKMKAEWANQMMAGGTAKSINAVNQTHHDTAESKWGGSSIRFDGSSDFLELTNADSALFQPFEDTTSTWTFDAWVKFNSVSGTQWYISQGQSTSDRWGFYHITPSNTGHYAILSNGGGTQFNGNGTGNGGLINDTTTWHHVMWIKKATEIGMYVDGTQCGYIQNTQTLTSNGQVYIGGKYDGSEEFNGWMDDIRICNGNPFNASPNTGNTDTITVPTAAHTADSTTMLLVQSDHSDGSTDITDSSPTVAKHIQLHGWAVNY